MKLQDSERVARVTHVCDCGDIIDVGERYRYQFSVTPVRPHVSKLSLEHEHQLDDEWPVRRKLTRQERLEGLADRGTDTIEEANCEV